MLMSSVLGMAAAMLFYIALRWLVLRALRRYSRPRLCGVILNCFHPCVNANPHLGLHYCYEHGHRREGEG